MEELWTLFVAEILKPYIITPETAGVIIAGVGGPELAHRLLSVFGVWQELGGPRKRSIKWFSAFSASALTAYALFGAQYTGLAQLLAVSFIWGFAGVSTGEAWHKLLPHFKLFLFRKAGLGDTAIARRLASHDDRQIEILDTADDIRVREDDVTVCVKAKPREKTDD